MSFEDALVNFFGKIVTHEAAKEMTKGVTAAAAKTLLEKGLESAKLLRGSISTTTAIQTPPAEGDESTATVERAGEQERANTSKILIVGSGGVGKSTLGKLFAWECDWTVSPKPTYFESRDIEEYPLGDDNSVSIVVLPGQKHRRNPTWSTVNADISAGKYEGVIHVGAFGYHTTSIGREWQNLKKKNEKFPAFVKRFVADQQKEEVAVLRHLLPGINANAQSLWLLTVVTKQDLWWTQRSAIGDFYSNGPYGKVATRIATSKTQGAFRHEVAAVSLVICNFRIGEQIARKTAGGYDQPAQIGSVLALFDRVKALREWGRPVHG